MPADVVAMCASRGSTSSNELARGAPVEAAGIGVAAQQRDRLLIGDAERLRRAACRCASTAASSAATTAPVDPAAQVPARPPVAAARQAFADHGRADDHGGVEHRRHRGEEAPLHEVAAEAHDVERDAALASSAGPEKAPRRARAAP